MQLTLPYAPPSNINRPITAKHLPSQTRVQQIYGSLKTAVVSDFLHFQAGSVDFELVVVKCCVCGTFKSDGCYSVRFAGDIHFQNQTLKSVALRWGQNCSGILFPHWTLHSWKNTAMSASVLLAGHFTLILVDLSWLTWITMKITSKPSQLSLSLWLESGNSC